MLVRMLLACPDAMGDSKQVIHVEDCSKVFRVHKKQPGLMGSIRSLFHRAWEEKQALRDVSLTVNEGEIVGLVGANGAGKTTLVKILSGIIHPSAGKVSVLGHNPWDRQNEFRSRIALIMGQKAQLWWDLPAADCFLLLREMYSVPRDVFARRLEELAATLDVRDLLTTQIRRLSLGERMKMELIAALLHSPKVLFLDEPTIGLDLTSQRAMRQFILQYRERHQPAMILTSHYMEDIKTMCRRIVIIRKGSVVYDGSIDHIVADHTRFKIVTAQLAGQMTRSDIEGVLPDGFAAEIHINGQELRVQVERDRAADAAQFLLLQFDVADIAIEEEDISTIIESIQTEG